MASSNWRSNIAVAGGVVLGVAVAFATAGWVAVAQSPTSERGARIESRPGDQKGDAAPAPLPRPSISRYQPDCARPQRQEDAVYCELRRLADHAEELTALAKEANGSASAQSSKAGRAARRLRAKQDPIDNEHAVSWWRTPSIGRDGNSSTTVVVETDLVLDAEDEDYDKEAVDSLLDAVRKYINANKSIEQVLIEPLDDEDDGD
jgi:hypothetical protein